MLLSRLAARCGCSIHIVHCALRRGNGRRHLLRKAVWLDPASGRRGQTEQTEQSSQAAVRLDAKYHSKSLQSTHSETSADTKRSCQAESTAAIHCQLFKAESTGTAARRALHPALIHERVGHMFRRSPLVRHGNMSGPGERHANIIPQSRALRHVCSSTI